MSWDGYRGLRERAESALAGRRADDDARVEPPPDSAASWLIQELRVHRVELEMQNDELRRTRHMLEDSRDAYRQLFERATVGFLLCASDGRILDSNPRARALLGVDELAGVSFPSFATDDARDAFYLHVRREPADGTPRRLNLPIVRGDGVARLLEVDTTTVVDDRGRVERVHVCFVDATDSQRDGDSPSATGDLNEMLRREKLESVGRLAGGIAHDFNNILARVLGNLFVAQSLEERDEVLDVLADAAAAARDGARITSQLLTFAEGGAPVRELVDMRRLLEQGSRFALRGTNVTCVLELEDGLGAVEGDAALLAQVVHNVVCNAAESMPDGGVLRIRGERITRPGRPGTWVSLHFEDQGSGIAAADLGRVFDAFFTTKDHGRGLGLATASRIAESHGGQLRIESRLGEGTTVSLYLRTPVLANIDVEEEAPISMTSTKGARALVMDDDDGICRMLRRILCRRGYEVVVTHDGAEAVAQYAEALAANERFDVVILDLNIPSGMGGVDALDELRALDADVRAVVSSAYSSSGVMADFRSYGFRAVARKPYGEEELLAAIVLAMG